jgi:nitrogenase subunit NifH
MVYLFESVEEAAQRVSSLVDLSPDVEVVKKYRAIQKDLDENAMNLLVDSWL